jgi:hypothetical protein
LYVKEASTMYSKRNKFRQIEGPYVPFKSWFIVRT